MSNHHDVTRRLGTVRRMPRGRAAIEHRRLYPGLRSVLRPPGRQREAERRARVAAQRMRSLILSLLPERGRGLRISIPEGLTPEELAALEREVELEA